MAKDFCEYDIALSFAGEQRGLVEAIAKVLTRQRVREASEARRRVQTINFLPSGFSLVANHCSAVSRMFGHRLRLLSYGGIVLLSHRGGHMVSFCKVSRVRFGLVIALLCSAAAFTEGTAHAIACFETPLLCVRTDIGPGTSIADKLAAAENAALAGDLSGFCGTLNALEKEFRAQAGKKIAAADAASALDLLQLQEFLSGC
jgi:hypothetical protein